MTRCMHDINSHASFPFDRFSGISGLMHDTGLDVEEDGQNEGLNDSKGSVGVDSSSPRRAPTNSSPSHKMDGVQL